MLSVLLCPKVITLSCGFHCTLFIGMEVSPINQDKLRFRSILSQCYCRYRQSRNNQQEKRCQDLHRFRNSRHEFLSINSVSTFYVRVWLRSHKNVETPWQISKDSKSLDNLNWYCFTNVDSFVENLSHSRSKPNFLCWSLQD